MKRLFPAVLGVLVASGTASAGSSDNIEACVQALREHVSRDVDAFDARYDGNLLRYSKVEWQGILCEVKLSTVFNLTVDGEAVIVDQFAGRDAKALHERLEVETEDAVNVLKNRIRLLESRLSEAEERLRVPSPDLAGVEDFVRDGIEKAL